MIALWVILFIIGVPIVVVFWIVVALIIVAVHEPVTHVAAYDKGAYAAGGSLLGDGLEYYAVIKVYHIR